MLSVKRRAMTSLPISPVRGSGAGSASPTEKPPLAAGARARPSAGQALAKRRESTGQAAEGTGAGRSTGQAKHRVWAVLAEVTSQGAAEPAGVAVSAAESARMGEDRPNYDCIVDLTKSSPPSLGASTARLYRSGELNPLTAQQAWSRRTDLAMRVPERDRLRQTTGWVTPGSPARPPPEDASLLPGWAIPRASVV